MTPRQSTGRETAGTRKVMAIEVDDQEGDRASPILG
jgi:hypothetical protein